MLTATFKGSADGASPERQLGYWARIDNQILLVGGFKIVVYK